MINHQFSVAMMTCNYTKKHRTNILEAVRIGAHP